MTPGDPTRTTTLDELRAGDVAQVVREAPPVDAPLTVEDCDRGGLVAGTRVIVLSIGPNGLVTVQASKGVVELSERCARDVFVVLGDLAATSDAVVRDDR
jgi:hypothetical protein